MLAFLKSIFGGRTAAPQSNGGLAIPRTVYTPQPRSNSPHRPSKTPAVRPTQKPPPAPAPVAVPAAVPDPENAFAGDVDISLQSVLLGLPSDLKDRVRDLDIRGATMTISLERILAQLPSGAVKISFGSLRHAAPQLFSEGADSDLRDVTLPLDEILSKVNPAMICPPSEQPIQRFNPPESEPDTSQAPQRASRFSVPPVSAPGEFSQPPQSIPTAAPRNSIPEPVEETPAAAIQTSSREEIPDLFFEARTGAHPNCDNDHDAESPAVPEAAPPVQPEVSQSAADQSVMRIALKELINLWPENVRTEVSHWNLDQLMVALPADKINAGLKQGKVVFTWECFRSWILPSPPAASSLQDKALLELPLPVIMPLFLAARKQSSTPVTRLQPQIADDIPDPFADFLPQAQNAPHPQKESPNIRVAPEANRAATATKKSAKAAATPAVEKSSNSKVVARDQVSAPKSAQVAQKSQPETTPESPAAESKSSTPAEVLANAVQLDGVAGALVALSDGFKVASKLPPGLDGDALAAFLPHIFSKVNQSTRELRMGDLNNLNFTVDNVPWKIFRVDQIFFAALGHIGKPMPTDQLVALAHKLTFKN